MKIDFSQGYKAVLAAVALVALTPGAGAAWKADNRLDVNPLSGGEGFEVIGKPGSPGSEYWCAAGDYALRVLGAPGTARVYILRGRGTPETSERRSGVQFTMTPPPGTARPSPPFLSMKRVGDNLSVTFARTYCLDYKNLEF